MTKLDGRSLSENILKELAKKISQLKVPPKLGIVLVGNDPASQLYVRLKEKAAGKIGIAIEKILLPESSSTEEVIAGVNYFNAQADTHGILIQLPLPAQINERAVISAMQPNKDADGFHPKNLQAFIQGKSAIIPGLAAGIMKLIELSGKDFTGYKATLLANSDEFAEPLVKMLGEKNVQSCILKKPEPSILRASDIIIVALGQPGIIKAEHVKNGAIVIDVGTTKVGGKLTGDVDKEVTKQQVYLTPVPGGVGPMTVAMLLWNVYLLAQAKKLAS